MTSVMLFSPLLYVAFGILGLVAVVLLFRRSLVGVGLLGLFMLVFGSLLLRINQPVVTHPATPPFNTMTRIEADGFNIDVAIPPIPTQAPTSLAPKLRGGRTWASILMAAGVVVMAGVILRASTHRLRRTIQT